MKSYTNFCHCYIKIVTINQKAESVDVHSIDKLVNKLFEKHLFKKRFKVVKYYQFS